MLGSNFAILALAASALALPQGYPSQPRPTQCITTEQAIQVGQNFGMIVSNYSDALANSILAPTFSETSDSVITLIDNASQPQTPLLLNTTFAPTRDILETGARTQPGHPFKVLNTWHECRQVIIRFVSQQTPQQVQGFSSMQVIPNTNRTAAQQYPYLINTTYYEFNSGAWLVNRGNPQCNTTTTTPPPPANTTAASS